MSELVQSIDRMIEILNKAKTILEEESLESLLRYYEEGLYKEDSLSDVTTHVHGRFADVVTEVLNPVKAVIRLREVAEDVVTFTFESELLGPIGEMEVPEPMLFIKGTELGKKMEEQDVEELVKYTNYLVKVQDVLKKHNIRVGFY